MQPGYPTVGLEQQWQARPDDMAPLQPVDVDMAHDAAWMEANRRQNAARRFAPLRQGAR